MATVPSQPDQAANLLQNLSLDPQSKNIEAPVPSKKTSPYQYSSIDSEFSSNAQIQSSERPLTPYIPNLMDPTMCYLPNGYTSSPCYYPTFNGAGTEWDDYSRYVNHDGVDISSMGIYGENGSVMYHNGYGYSPYAPYSPATSPVPLMSNDVYGHQQYQYPSYFQPLPSASGSMPAQTTTSLGEVSTSVTPDQKPLLVESGKGNTCSTVANGSAPKGLNGSTPYGSMLHNSPYGTCTLPGGLPASSYQAPPFGYDGGQYRSSNSSMNSFSKMNNVSSLKNRPYQNSNFMGLQHQSPISAMGSTHGYMGRLYQSKFYGQYANPTRTSIGSGYGGYDLRTGSPGWLTVDGKYKPRGQDGYFGFRNETCVDGLNELNKGPRAKGFKSQNGNMLVTLAMKGQQNVMSRGTVTQEKVDPSASPDREQYNRPDFPEDYTDAKFFVIKSYSEDDIHKSIKYSVWASTPKGNKKLDAAYQEAQQKLGGCPIFLLFSVNTSGQFVGLAEMVGSVDFSQSVEYWQQDKWTGCFPVKWHIVKDISNTLLKHILLENNENKPVTNSRDTQEVKLEHGLKIIKIFKDYSSKTSILDDFVFYENRQKIIQDKKARQLHLQKQIVDQKASMEKKETAAPEIVKETNEQTTSIPQQHEVASAAKFSDHSKLMKPVASEMKTTNGTINGC